MEKVYENLLECLTRNLKSKSFNKKELHFLQTLYETSDLEFERGLESVFLQLSDTYDENPYAQRGLKVLSLFFQEFFPVSKIEPKTLKNFCSLVLSGCEAAKKSCRLSSSWMLSQLIPLIQTMNLSSKTSEELAEVTNTLLKDKYHQIRVQAVSIFAKMGRTDELLKLLQIEQHKEVRRHIICSLKADKKAFKSVAKRTRDLEPEVRLAAVKFLQQDKEFLYLKEALLAIANERDETAKKEAVNLVRMFVSEKGVAEFGRNFEFNKKAVKVNSDLLRALKLVFESFCGKDRLEDFIRKNSEKFNEMSEGEIVVLRVACQVAQAKDENLVFSLLPEMDDLMGLIENLRYPLVLSQNLLKICCCMDICERGIRSNFVRHLIALLLKFPVGIDRCRDAELIRECSEKMGADDFLATSDFDVFYEISFCMNLVCNSVELYREYLCVTNEIIDKLFNQDLGEDSLLRKKEILENKLRDLNEEYSILENENSLFDFDVKGKINLIEEELSIIDEEVKYTLRRALMTVCGFLKYASHDVMTTDFYEIINKLIPLGLKYKENHLESLALECLEMYCLLSNNLSSKYIPIFQTVLKKDKDDYSHLVSLRAVIEICAVHNLPEKQSSEIFELLNLYCKKSNDSIKSLAIEGACKLYFMSKMNRQDILANLLFTLIQLDSPDQVKQCLLVFFTNFPLISSSSSLLLCKSFILFISAISSPVYKENYGIDYNSTNVSKTLTFIFQYLDLVYLKDNAAYKYSKNLHFFIFFYLSKEILKNVESAQSKSYLKIVLQVNYSTFNLAEASISFKMLKEIAEKVKEKKVLSKVIDKVCNLFERLDSQVDQEISEFEKEYEEICCGCKEYLFCLFKGEDLSGKDEFSNGESMKRKRLLDN